MERQYRVWEGQCKAGIQKAGQLRKVEEKVYYYFNEGPMSVLKDGDNLLKEIERKMDAKSEQIEAIISKIRIVENQGIPNSLFNYLNVVMHNNISTPVKSDSPPEVTLTSSIRIKTE